MPLSTCVPFEAFSLKQLSFRCNYVRRWAICDRHNFFYQLHRRSTVCRRTNCVHAYRNRLGTLNGAPFNDTMFVITAYGDTANRQVVSSRAYSIEHSSAAIDLNGIGNFAFTLPTRTFSNHGDKTVGFVELHRSAERIC